MHTLQSDLQLQEMMQNDKTILMFSADWCPDCRIIEPVLPELEEKHSDWTFVYVDRDEFIHVCQEHDVYGIPSFIAFKDGKEAGRFVSKNRKSKEEIDSFIENL